MLVGIIVFVLVVLFAAAAPIGLASWLGRKVGVDASPRTLRKSLSVLRRRRRESMTRGQRALAWALTFGPMPLVLAGVIVLLGRRGHALGIVLLAVGLLAMATPVSPILSALRARQERRG